LPSTIRTRVVVGLMTAPDSRFPIVADLAYHPGDPYAVRLTCYCGGDITAWTFARDLLWEGISGPAGEGVVRVHPVEGESGQICIELHSATGTAVLRAPRAPLAAFLARTPRRVPVGGEASGRALDAEITEILDNGG